MLSEKMVQLGTNRSVIRDLFEYGNKRKAEIGAENVFDFSIGNPSVPAPECVKEAAIDLLTNGDPVALHGYTSAQGDAALREKLASYVNEQHSTNLTADNFYVTVGAAASLTISLKALAEPDDEFITFAPFFPEYRVFVEMTGSKLVVVPSRKEDFQIDTKLLEDAITEHTKGIILNSPNNPSGVVLTEECIKEVCAVLEKKQKEFGHDIYLVSDEPYRELVYDGNKEDFLTKYYKNTIVGYSFSKSLSLPGERIGYVVVPNEASDAEELIRGIEISNRTLGFVNAPSLIQKAVARCLDEKTDVSFYDENRTMLYDGLTELGFTCIKPEGAFYLWVKSPVDNEEEFVEEGKKLHLLMVKGSAFGCGGFVRLAYCVSHETVKNSLPAFEKLAQVYGLK